MIAALTIKISRWLLGIYVRRLGAIIECLEQSLFDSGVTAIASKAGQVPNRFNLLCGLILFGPARYCTITGGSNCWSTSAPQAPRETAGVSSMTGCR